jgi:hypothetical protein
MTEISIILDDGSSIEAARHGALWSLSWAGRRWQGRSLVALVDEVPGPGLGPATEVLRQVLDALIAEIDRPAAVDRCLRSHVGAHY